MAKITTIIDIGSNSARMVVFKKTSRYGYTLINETKSKVKISEGTYNNGGNLQEIPMQRAFGALQSFVKISQSLKSRKILCVATSALRDAPNKKVFLNKVQKELGLSIKVIDGEKEAYYGAVATSNLLHVKDYMSIDIGGGSTEFCSIKEGRIEQYFSLNIGTVRLKELYFNQNDLEGAKNYIHSKLKEYEEQFKSFDHTTLVAIGGSSRALSRMVIEKEKYPLDALHAFTYETNQHLQLMENIVEATTEKQLRQLKVKKDRYDTIREGTFIFKTIVEYFGIQKVVTSGVGVREGVYLSDLLRTNGDKFPANFNVSVRSLLDRFELDGQVTAYMGTNVGQIFDTLAPMHGLTQRCRKALVIAAKLHSIGVTLNFYKYSEHAFDFILKGLSYGFSHEERVMIAHIIKFTKKTPSASLVKPYTRLLPDLEKLKWMSFMMGLNLRLNADLSSTKYQYELVGNKLIIKTPEEKYIANDLIDKMAKPKFLKVVFQKA